MGHEQSEDEDRPSAGLNGVPKRVELVSELTGLLYDKDPIDLQSFGVPPDEYSSEAEMITARLPSASGVHDVRRIVHQVFVQMFDADIAGPEAAYRPLAFEIWELWQHATSDASGSSDVAPP